MVLFFVLFCECGLLLHFNLSLFVGNKKIKYFYSGNKLLIVIMLVQVYESNKFL